MAQKKTDYPALSRELDEILLELQAGELDVDVAMRKYERGLELVKLLEGYLTDAENTVTKLRLRFEDQAER